MARTEAGAELTQLHRSSQLQLRSGVLSGLVNLWATVDPTNLEGTINPFASAAAVLVRAGNRDSSGLAAGYFREFRAAEGVPGTAAARLADVPAADVVTGLLRGAALASIVGARRRGFSPGAAARVGLTNTLGTATSQILAGSRYTILGSIRGDSRGDRWQRVTSGSPCAFCAMLASRGPVYNANTADFQSHGHCSCEPEPAYPGSRATAQNARLREQWEEAQRTVDPVGGDYDALNRFRRFQEGRV